MSFFDATRFSDPLETPLTPRPDGHQTEPSPYHGEALARDPQGERYGQNVMFIFIAAFALFLIGINVHALLIEASGWPRYVREELARRPDARRRAQRKLMGSVLLGTAMIFTYQHVADGEPIAKSALQAVTFGVVMTVFCWWNELRGTRPTTRRDEPI